MCLISGLPCVGTSDGWTTLPVDEGGGPQRGLQYHIITHPGPKGQSLMAQEMKLVWQHMTVEIFLLFTSYSHQSGRLSFSKSDRFGALYF